MTVVLSSIARPILCGYLSAQRYEMTGRPCTVAAVVGQPIAIRLLGPVDVRVGSAPLSVDTRKAVALLAYLATTGRPASREVLAALLWPEADDESARGALRRTLSVLKAAVGAGRLEIDRAVVTLVRDGADIDIAAFRTALMRARRHEHGPTDSCRSCIAALRASVALDRGPFMDGFALRDSEPFDEWLLAEREDHRRQLAGALERLARLSLAASDVAAALSAGGRWLSLDPLHEPAHRLLMETHARAGEPTAAIAQYRDCVRTLDRELGVAPLPETTELYEAIRDGAIVQPSHAAREDGPGDVDDRGSVPFVDRAAERAALIAAIDGIGSDGVTLAIEGEAGIGKTRLADELSAEVRRRSGTALAAAAYPGESGIAFGPIVALLRVGLAATDPSRLDAGTRRELARLLPELVDGSPDGQELVGPFAVHRLLEAIAAGLGGLTAGRRPGLVRVDDIQWADESTLEALAYLARRLTGRRIAVLVSFRREDLDARTEPLVGRLLASAGLVIRLGRLAPEDARRLATAAWRRPTPPDDTGIDALVAESEGLPLYVIEAAADVGDRPGTPPGVRALLESRIAGLSELGRQVASAGAILGRSFDLDSVRLTSGRSEDETVEAVEELVRRAIVRELPERGDLDFVHGRLRDVAVESTSLARRRLLHRRAADALRAGHSEPARPREPAHARAARIAHHEREAGRDTEAAEAFVEAGRLARAVFANREAEADLEAALGLGHPDAGPIHMALGDLRTLAGDYTEAISRFEAAAALTDPADIGPLEHRLGLVHQRRGDFETADGHFGSALDLAADRAERATILADRSLNAAQAGDADQAASLAQEALAEAEASGDQAAAARAANVAGLLATDRGAPDGEALLRRSLAISTDRGDEPAMVAAMNNLARAASTRGDLAGATGLTEDALALCRSIGDRHREAALLNNLSDLLHAAGREAEAMDRLKTAVAIFAEVGDPGTLEPGKWRMATW
jgi:DNA-binding SARP family transcriptional activator/Tfp pilus assembly protein PilF